MSTTCRYARLSVNDKSECPADISPRKIEESVTAEDGRDQSSVDQFASKCPVPRRDRDEQVAEDQPSPKCPFGYDSVSFKIGPLSCVICRALLFDSSRCVPCQHIFCRICISRFQDCVVCGADIEEITADPQLQRLVDRFIEGHARIKRPPVSLTEGSVPAMESPPSNAVSYEDVSLARGSFLIQHAMRAFQTQNFESAKSRLQLCAEDTREELARTGSATEICSQLGAVLGMLGDCWPQYGAGVSDNVVLVKQTGLTIRSCNLNIVSRSIGDAEGAMTSYEESVELLSDLPHKDDEVVHALSVSLNKLGDLKYYAEDLNTALAFYRRALHLRQQGTDLTKLSSQVLDVAVSIAKVADVNRALGSKGAAAEGFQEALKTLKGCTPANATEATLLEPRRQSVLEFLQSQFAADKAS